MKSVKNIELLFEFSSYSHFSLFRKIVHTKSSGIMRFEGVDGFNGFLLFNHGELCKKASNPETLAFFLCQPLSIVRWENGLVEMSCASTKNLLLAVINGIEWPKERLDEMGDIFGKLPHVYVDHIDVKFENFLVNISYDLFSQMASKHDGVSPAVYLLHDDPDNSLIPYRMRIFCFLYLLHLIHPIDAPKPLVETNKKQSFLQRIINKINKITS